MATYRRYGLTGGASGALDALDGTNLTSADAAITLGTDDKLYIHKLNPSSGAAESSPDIISPNTNAGNKRWILCQIYGAVPGVTDVTATSPVVSSGGNTPAISIPAATNAANGYMTKEMVQAVEANNAKVTNATHTGDVTGATGLTIAAKAVTLAKMDDMATASLIYRKTAGAGTPEVNTLATLKTDLGLSGTNSGDSATPAETTTTIGALINGATTKTSAVDADYLGLMDSEGSNVLKKLSWAYVKSILKTYFDTQYTGGASVPSATAESDFIIAGASPFAWAKKTLAEAKTILGLVLTQTSQTIGFTLSGGATSKTLTVALDASVSGTNTGDSAGHTTLVAGPASAVDGKVVLFDGTTGKLVKDSGLSLSGSNTGDSATPAETTTTIGALINGATAKTSAVDADYLPLMDSEASNVMKKLSWAYVKSILKTYFDGIYSTFSAAAPGTIGGTTPGIIYGLNGEIFKTASGDSPLTALQVSGTIVSNYGMTDADCVISVPTAAAGYSFVLILPAVRARYFKLRAGANDKFYLLGVAGSDNGYVGVASGYATGASCSVFTFKASDGNYDWFVIPIFGTWVAS